MTVMDNSEKSGVHVTYAPAIYSESSGLFKDGRRRIDFVIVYERERSEKQKKDIDKYFTNLRQKGIQIEIEEGVKYTELVFVKLHAPEQLLLDIANIHNVILTYEKDRTVPHYRRRLKPFKNALSRRPNPQNPLFDRVSNVARGVSATEISSAERILLVNYLLARTDYGDDITEYGLPKLISNKTFETAYPLHDGEWQWNYRQKLNDRQLLAEFWANAKCWYQAQPLHVIYKYYGAEVAFRFAWLGYYNKMLIPVSIIGVLVFCYSWMMLRFPGYHRLKEICQSDVVMCPTCAGEKCTFKKLSSACKFAKITYLVDNWAGVIFAVLVSIWATFFVEYWKRLEVKLLFKWNLLGADTDIEMRPQYEWRTAYRRISKNTGSIEAYVPLKFKLLNYTVSSAVCCCMVIMVILTVLFNIVVGKLLRNGLHASNSHFLISNMTIIYMILTSIIGVLFIRIYDPFFAKLSMLLTKLENQRTTSDFYNSYIIKRYLMGFCNNYLGLFYLALVKGKLFTHPGDSEQYNRLLGLKAETCHPSGCLSRVTIYLTFLMVMKKTALKSIKYAMPHVRRCYAKAKASCAGAKVAERIEIPQWEDEFKLGAFGELHFVPVMMDRILQYGIILFFVSALPLLPLIALIGNIVDLRVGAQHLVKDTRRPVPRRLPGLGAWNGIIAASTYFSIFFNALMIAFTTEFVSREVYRYTYGSLRGYINSTLSEFAVNDFDKDIRDRLQKSSNVSTCYFKGYRHKPNEPNKYQHNDEYYYQLAMAFFMIVIFEHVVLILTGVLAYAIPDVPFSIREHLAYEDQQLVAAKAKSN